MATDFAQPGRQWVVSRSTAIPIIPGLVKASAVQRGHCQRCGSLVAGRLPTGEEYCRVCIGLGRVLASDLLVRNESPADWPSWPAPCCWSGRLTSQQGEIAQALVESLKAGRSHLVQAVTGAGKTEMLFPALTWALQRGKRIALASPRIDVVNELAPRLRAAFAVEIGVQHGQTGPLSQNYQFIVCTTHQLLKFYRAFDLLVIDEVDAFPFNNSLALAYAARAALKAKGSIFFLTATPPAHLLQAVKKGELVSSQLVRRFHGYPLPVPQLHYCNRQEISAFCPLFLQKKIKQAQASGHQLLVFLPRIEALPNYLAAYRAAFPRLQINTVSAEDPDRLEKIAAFRARKLDLLLTTTILERGVTFPKVWVIVWQAEDRIYQPASLVQIAGRVGRSAADPNGLVLFCYHRYTRALRLARRQIKKMNQ